MEITNWRGVVAPPDIEPAERDAAIAAMEKLHDSPQWKAALEKNDWTDFFKTGDEFETFLQDREHAGEGRPPGHRAHRVRQSWTGPRLAGLRPAGRRPWRSCIAVTEIPGRGGYATSGPRFVPLIVACGLILLSALFLLRTWVRPDVALAERSAEEDAATHWATPGLILVALLVYAFALEPVGYPLATAVVFVVLARMLGLAARSCATSWRGSCSASGCSPRSRSTSGVSLPAGLTPIF